MAKESCILAYELCTFQFFSNLLKTKPYITNKIQRISATSGKRWATDKVETDSDTDTDAARTGTSSQNPRVPHEDPPGRLSGDVRKQVLEKIVELNGVNENMLIEGTISVMPTKMK